MDFVVIYSYGYGIVVASSTCNKWFQWQHFACLRFLCYCRTMINTKTAELVSRSISDMISWKLCMFLHRFYISDLSLCKRKLTFEAKENKRNQAINVIWFSVFLFSWSTESKKDKTGWLLIGQSFLAHCSLDGSFLC